MNFTAKSTRRADIKGNGVLSLICIIVGTCSFTMAQADRAFIDKANGFKITLAGEWRAEPYSDAVGRQKTEFISENRTRGLLRVTRGHLSGSSIQSTVRREIDEFALCYSSVSIGQEAFGCGSLSGIRISLFYVEGDRRIVGTTYFLQDKEAVWILRFNGQAGSSGMSRSLTDSMACSFCPACGLGSGRTG
jgi:hypothetical protein